MSDLDGKVALVTGASRGMGAATARMLAERNVEVFTAQRGPAGYKDIACDLADPNAPKIIIDEIAVSAGKLDILVNNAGVMREGEVGHAADDDWHLQMAINVNAPYLLIHHGAEMLKAAKGAIVNVGSIEGLGSNPNHAAYCTSKAAIHGLTRAVAVDLGPYGVRCNAVAPGWIDTELNVDFVNSLGGHDAFADQIGRVHPLGRTGQPHEVAELILWLASPKASFVTGQILTIDGGRTAKLSLPDLLTK